MLSNFYILILLSLLSSLQQLYACATCMSGDPTLTLMGTEKPFPNRLRVATDFSYRRETVGIEKINDREIEEYRLNLGLTYSFSERLNLAIRLPLVRKQLTEVNLAQSETQQLGDAEISMKFFAHQDRPTQPTGGLLGGLRLPTASEQEDRGQTLDIDVQPGAGNWVVNGGAWYGQYQFPWLFYASSVVRYALNDGFQEFSEGTAVVTTLLTQYAYSPKLAFQLGLDTRWSEKHQYSGEDDPNSGGFIGFITHGIVINLAEDLLLNVAVQLPAIKNLNGDHEEKTTFQIGLVYDF